MGQEVGKCMISDQGLDKFIKLYEQKYAIKLDREKAFDAGCNDYIAKPLSPTLLRNLIIKYFVN